MDHDGVGEMPGRSCPSAEWKEDSDGCDSGPQSPAEIIALHPAEAVPPWVPPEWGTSYERLQKIQQSARHVRLFDKIDTGV